MKKGQISIEYLMIIGLILLVTIPLFVYAFVEVKRSIQMNHAEDAVNTIANAADTVYSLGPGSKKYVWITTPGGVTQTLVNNTEISMKLYIFKGESDVFATTKPIVIGSIPAEKGPHRVAAESLGSGVVRIGEVIADDDPPNITRVYPNLTEGQNVCPGQVTIGADTDEAAMCNYDEADKDYYDMEFEFEGRAISHYKTLYLTEGSYTYYARCIDYYENVMEESAEISFEVATPCVGGGIYGPEGPCYGQPEDTNNPVVNLQTPEDEEIITFPLVDFNYTATDVTSGIEYCVVNISDSNKELYAQAHDSSVSETEVNSVQFAFNEKGIFTWNVFCVDDSCAHNQEATEYRTVNISKDFFDAFLTSCAGWCGWNGYLNGGGCVNTRTGGACSNGCVPILSTTYKECYAGDHLVEGELVDNLYCDQSTSAKYCCCLPS